MGGRNLLEQRKPFVNFICIYQSSHQTPRCGVRKRKAEKAEIQSGSGGFYHNERLKKNKI